jgi:hypothetical protein
MRIGAGFISLMTGHDAEGCEHGSDSSSYKKADLKV